MNHKLSSRTWEDTNYNVVGSRSLAVMRWQTKTGAAVAELSFFVDNTSVTTSNLLTNEGSIQMSLNQTRGHRRTTEQNLIENSNFEPPALQEAVSLLRQRIANLHSVPPSDSPPQRLPMVERDLLVDSH